MTAREALIRVTSDAELNRIYSTHVATKSASGRDGMSPEALGERWPIERKLIRRKLRSGAYRFAAYKQLLVSKGPSQQPRILSIPTARDRVVLKSLAQVLIDSYPEARTKVPQALVAEVMEAVSSGAFEFYVRLDVKDFYPSVRHSLVESALRSRIRSRPVLVALMAAITTPTLGKQGQRGSTTNDIGVPQGLAISNLLAEVAFEAIDAEIAAIPNSLYFRYVDDILILTNLDPNSVFVEASNSVRDRAFEVHPLGNVQKSAVGVVAEGIDYLGYRWTGQQWGVRSASRQRVLDSIARDFSHYREPRAGGHTALVRRVNLTITGCIYERNARGWMHFYSQVTDVSMLRSLDRVVRKLATRHGIDAKKFHSFERTYWLIRHPDSRSRKYIPDFDRYSEDEMRELLSELHPDRDFAEMRTPELERTFRVEVARIVSRLERDVGEIS